MKDQALKLRELASEHKVTPGLSRPNLVGLSSSPRTVAITSGKGGVGKTNLTINLGLALAEGGRRVTLLDADLGLANINVALGLKVKANLLDVINGLRSIEEIVVDGPGGLKIVPGGSGIAELANISDQQRERLIAGLSRLAKGTDVLLIDTSAGISRNVLAFALLADVVIVVTVPEPPAIADAYGTIKALLTANPGLDIKLVVNRVQSRFEGKAVEDKISLVVRRFLNGRIDPIGCLRDNPVVGDAVRAQKPLMLEYPSANVSVDIKSLVGRLYADSDRSDGVVRGFVDRLRRWFS